jgi:hypothetical protein
MFKIGKELKAGRDSKSMFKIGKELKAGRDSISPKACQWNG